MMNLIEPEPEGAENGEIGATKDDTPDYGEEELANAD
jgi:hypothetical protein